MSSRVLPWCVFALMALGGCAGRSPEEELRPLLEDLGDPGRAAPSLGARLFRALDEPSRSAVTRRSKEVGEALGVAVEPGAILQVRGLVSSRRVSGVEVVARDGDRATLEVSFASLIEGSSGDAGLVPMKLEVIREAGSWKLSLRDFSRLMESVPSTVVAGEPRGER